MDENMKIGGSVLLVSVLFLVFIPLVMAHCPLCTIGAGAAAAGAVWFGVSKVVVALFIGAFAMSMGIWFSGIPKKRYVPFQRFLIVSLVFLSTVIPLIPVFSAVGPLHFSFIGEYGTTYVFDYSIAGIVLGGLVVLASPSINRKLKKLTGGKGIPYQGIAVTFALLLILALVLQVKL